MSSGGKLMEKLFQCKTKSNNKIDPVKRSTAVTENEEVQEMYGHSKMRLSKTERMKETVAKG